MREVKLKFGGSIFIEEFGDQEEKERIKVFDSNMGYLDYFPVESIYRLADKKGLMPREWLEELYTKCENAEDIWQLLDLVLGEPFTTPLSWEELLAELAAESIDTTTLTKENIADASDINCIGDYFFYVS